MSKQFTHVPAMYHFFSFSLSITVSVCLFCLTLSRLLLTLCSPGKADLDNSYHDAFAAGQAGANCLALFQACPRGHNFLDELLIVEPN